MNHHDYFLSYRMHFLKWNLSMFIACSFCKFNQCSVKCNMWHQSGVRLQILCIFHLSFNVLEDIIYFKSHHFYLYFFYLNHIFFVYSVDHKNLSIFIGCLENLFDVSASCCCSLESLFCPFCCLVDFSP